MQVLNVGRIVEVGVQIGHGTPERDIRRAVTGDCDTASRGSRDVASAGCHQLDRHIRACGVDISDIDR